MIYAEFEITLVIEVNPKAFLILANMKKDVACSCGYKLVSVDIVK